MRKIVDVLGISVDSVTMQEAVEIVRGFLKSEKVHTIYTPNAEIMMSAQRDPELKNILLSADLIVADGYGVVLASRILGRSVPEKVSGFDLMKEIFREFAKNHTRYFLFGSKPGIADLAAENIVRDFPCAEIAGTRNGYFSEDDEEGIVKLINDSNPDVLLVALGAPKQEKWINKYKDRLNAKVCIGVGGTIDILSGKVELSPDFFRRNGLEWMYRLYKEPRRAKRMLDLPKFMIRVLLARLRGR
jgi:N-acetylglucosaminyldiphosphoundecaprenol N-acetyl-beta-D-mannosaminyltransferase